MVKLKNILISIIIIGIAISCQNGNKLSSDISHDTIAVVKKTEYIEFVKPFGGSQFKLGDVIDFQIRKLTDTVSFDSIIIKTGTIQIAHLDNSNLQVSWNSKDSKLGHITIEAIAYANFKVKQKISIPIQIASNSKPVQYTYKIIKTYPHSRDYYTQGLIYDNGFMYESDGLYTRSAIRKIKLETGEVVNFTKVDNAIFSEGIAMYKDRIYQISWREKTGSVYDKNTLEFDKHFNYSIAEGWGLEFDGQNFLMTDGSNNVYFMEPEYFTQVDKIEVFDDKGPVDNLNELELIKGKLYANVYHKDIVVIIDPHNGKIVGEIDFSGILPIADYQENTDVLNGIAWNPANGHLFITGKNWPKLFEVAIAEKK
jgi:glutaminyl-peptide cyclotransferase